MGVYLSLRNNPEYFINLCRQIKPAQPNEELTSTKVGGRKIYNKRLKEQFDWFVSDDFVRLNNHWCAVKYFYVNRTVFAGRVNYDIPSRMYFSNPSGWNIVKTDKLEKAGKILQNTKITHGSYQPLLAEGKECFCYLDPPYVVNTNLSRCSQLYKHNFTIADHIQLAKDVTNSKNKILISYDDNQLIRDLYKDFNIIEIDCIYSGTTNKQKKRGKELVITNY
jgi:DNA adenine methylase